MEKCVICGRKLFPENNYFSISHGGVLCGNCHYNETRKIRISGEAIKLIRIFLNNKIESLVKLKVPKKDVDNLRLIISETLNWIS